MAQRTTLKDRLLSKLQVDDETGCWNWTGAKHPLGYGQIFVERAQDGALKSAYVHRVAYELLVGPIPEGLTLDHLCRNRACCNPAHLEPVTLRVNGLRGNSAPAQNARKTHCKRGHPFAGDNLIIDGSGHRQCRTCVRRRDREKMRRRRQREREGR